MALFTTVSVTGQSDADWIGSLRVEWRTAQGRQRTVYTNIEHRNAVGSRELAY